jgi:hypothetical protein
MIENNTARVEIELDCGNCPIQNDEILDLKDKLYEVIFKWNRGIQIKNISVL